MERQRILTRFQAHQEMQRFLSFLKLVFILTALMFASWYLSAIFLPQGILRAYFSRLFSSRVGELTFSRVFVANLLPFFGIQFMNLFRVGKHPGGLYLLPIFWGLVGILYGTNSFVYATGPIPFSISVLWTRTAFNELLAYTLSYEASLEWAQWEQKGLWRVKQLTNQRWKPTSQDMLYWFGGVIFLVVAVWREVR